MSRFSLFKEIALKHISSLFKFIISIDNKKKKLVLGRRRDVVMAGRSRRSSTELEPDLSTPTAPKRPKQSETSPESSGEENLTEVESTETPTASEISLQAEVVVVREGEKQLSDVTEQAGTSKQSVLISKTSPESSKESSQTDTDIFERESVASTSTEAIPSTSREEQLGTLKTIVMKYSDQGELSGPSGRRSEETVQSLLLREHMSYEDLSLIGNGAYGTVYKAKDRTGNAVALKKVRIPLTEDGLPTSTLREIAVLKSLERYEHPHIVSIF